jgi:putative hydrolase of the HAD superfamily
MPKAIFIDIDNTLYSYSSAHSKAITAVHELVASQFEIAEENFDSVYRAARAIVKKKLAGSPSARNRLLYFQTMFELIGAGSSMLNALNCEQTYWNTLLLEAELFDGVKEFLDEVRLCGIPVIAITNMTAQIQFRKLVFFNLDYDIDFIVTSEQVGCEKPDRKIFEVALDHANCAGEDVWMIGDDLVCDIEGAKSSINATTLLRHDNRDKSLITSKAIDAHFSSFDNITGVLRKLGNENR